LPDLVNVDAEKQLLCEKTETKTSKEWAYQYKHAPLYLDREEALSELAHKPKDSVATATILSALNDTFFALREEAIVALKDIPPGHETEIKNKLVTIAKTDEKAEVRATALEFLSLKYKDEDLQAVYKNALNDKAYSVLGIALEAYAKANPQEGMKIAGQFENEKSKDILSAVAELYSAYGTDDNNEFFLKAQDKYKGFSAIEFITQYVSFLKNAKKDETVNSGVALLASIAKDDTAIKWVAYYAKKSISDLAIMYEEREKKAIQQLDNLKAANVNASTTELEFQIGAAKDQKLKITEIYLELK